MAVWRSEESLARRRAASKKFDHSPKGKLARRIKWTRKRLKVRRILHETKDVPCLDCGKRYPPYVMHFDHVKGEKKFNLSQAAAKATGLAKVLEEIAKCEIVCANCHAERTWGETP